MIWTLCFRRCSRSANPEGQLAVLPKGRKFKKRPDDYRRIEDELANAWPSVAARLTEAERFESEFLAAVGVLEER